jgi:hypothetical protein
MKIQQSKLNPLNSKFLLVNKELGESEIRVYRWWR